MSVPFFRSAVLLALAACSRASPSATERADAPPLVRARPYGLYVPPSYRAGTPVPLVVALHGLGHHGKGIAELFDLRALADAQTFLYAFPDGTPDAKYGRFWNATDACCD